MNDTGGWYPKFTKVVEAAEKETWPAKDLFPKYKMESFPTTQENWRRCTKCQGLFWAKTTEGVCPAGGAHVTTGRGSYVLMQTSKLPYGQSDWHWCQKCQGLFFGSGASKCPAKGKHVTSNTDYSLVLDSPYKEPQRNWRWCKKCQGLFFEGNKTSVCPGGAAHDSSSSGNYSLAGI
jgi:hypothetical protein